MKIKDDSGAGFGLKVDKNLRGWVNSVSHTGQEDATAKGLAYNLNTGLINLTTTADSALLYLKNNDANGRVFHVDNIAVGLGSAATVSDLTKITIVRNPTAGTIVSGASNVAMNQNRNFGSSESLTADVFKGADANTLTDGDDIVQFLHPEGSRLFASIGLDVPKGSSLGVKVLPTGISAGTMIAYVAIIGHLVETL